MTSRHIALDASHPGLAPLRAAGMDAARIEQVLRFYDEPHRAYHNRVHLQEIFDFVQAEGLQLNAAQALAVLFHDVIYVPGAARGSNEVMSAQLLRVYTTGVNAVAVDAACSIVTDTADHVARSQEAELVLDLDLMRLAAEPAQFDVYSQQVFAEQRPLIAIADNALAWTFFHERRLAFFERMLERPFIYCLSCNRDRFEAVARTNLQRAIREGKSANSSNTAKKLKAADSPEML